MYIHVYSYPLNFISKFLLVCKSASFRIESWIPASLAWPEKMLTHFFMNDITGTYIWVSILVVVIEEINSSLRQIIVVVGLSCFCTNYREQFSELENKIIWIELEIILVLNYIYIYIYMYMCIYIYVYIYVHLDMYRTENYIGFRNENIHIDVSAWELWKYQV
jgi:hypothetical protein